ncbi:uncharacterized protein [Choristoneura fumiferana]|uniref:uncharacterized protein n=1 Tax=Choristoneura fumiferana TaxID=7141 RepID=UPI003D159802
MCTASAVLCKVVLCNKCLIETMSRRQGRGRALWETRQPISGDAANSRTSLAKRFLTFKERRQAMRLGVAYPLQSKSFSQSKHSLFVQDVLAKSGHDVRLVKEISAIDHPPQRTRVQLLDAEILPSPSAGGEARAMSQSYAASEAGTSDRDSDGASTSKDKKLVTIKDPDPDLSDDSRNVFNVDDLSNKCTSPEEKDAREEENDKK